MKKLILMFLLFGVAGVMPLQFTEAVGNVRAVTVLVPINQEKGEQK